MIQYQGIGAVVITAMNSNAKVGNVCKYTDNHQVAAVGDGDGFHGVCIFEKNGEASVQVKGFVTTGYTGTAPSVGYGALAADGNGGVKTADGREYLITAVDTTDMTVTFCL